MDTIVHIVEERAKREFQQYMDDSMHSRSQDSDTPVHPLTSCYNNDCIGLHLLNISATSMHYEQAFSISSYIVLAKEPVY